MLVEGLVLKCEERSWTDRESGEVSRWVQVSVLDDDEVVVGRVADGLVMVKGQFSRWQVLARPYVSRAGQAVISYRFLSEVVDSVAARGEVA
jgi:hypothetical protein